MELYAVLLVCLAFLALPGANGYTVPTLFPPAAGGCSGNALGGTELRQRADAALTN